MVADLRGGWMFAVFECKRKCTHYTLRCKVVRRACAEEKNTGVQERFALRAPSRTNSGRPRGYVDSRLRRTLAGFARSGHNSVDCCRGQAWSVDNRSTGYPPPPPSPSPVHRVAPRLPSSTHIPPVSPARFACSALRPFFKLRLEQPGGGGTAATAAGEGFALHGGRGQSPSLGAASRRRRGTLNGHEVPFRGSAKRPYSAPFAGGLLMGSEQPELH